MTREEAIRRIKAWNLDSDDREVLAVIIPELRESEDERIRKEMVEKISNLACGCFISQEQKQKFIAYLEKQKEPHYTKRNALFDKCVAECDPEIMQRVSDEIDEMLDKERLQLEATVDMEKIDKSLEEAAYKYSFDSRPSIYGQVDVIDAFKAGAEWQKEQMLKIITKDDNLEEAGTQYVETYFRDIDWTPDVIKSCLEEAFISGGEYVFKQIKYE